MVSPSTAARASSPLPWHRVVRSGALLLVAGFTLPVLLPFLHGVVSASTASSWDASPARSVVDVVAHLLVIVGSWRLTATPLIVWPWRLLIIALWLAAFVGVLIKVGDDPRFMPTVLAAHAVSLVGFVAEFVLVLAARQIDKRSSTSGRPSLLWFVVAVLLAAPLLARLDTFTIGTAAAVGAVGVARVFVFVVALLRLRQRLV